MPHVGVLTNWHCFTISVCEDADQGRELGLFFLKSLLPNFAKLKSEIMETIIKVSPSELDINLLNKIKEFIGKNENIDVTISLKEMDVNYLKDLEHSVQQADENNLISFTMEDFMTYKPVPKS